MPSCGNSTEVRSEDDGNILIVSGVLFLMMFAFILCCFQLPRIVHCWNRIRLLSTAVANLLIRRQEPAVQPETQQPNVGPNPSVLPTIPALTFEINTNAGRPKSVRATECPICLDPMEEVEMLRILPICNHTFHVECIELWLQSHSSCPICRAKAAPSPPVVNPCSCWRMITLVGCKIWVLKYIISNNERIF